MFRLRSSEAADHEEPNQRDYLISENHAEDAVFGGRLVPRQWPDDLEALEHGRDLVVYLELFTVGLSGEIAAMSIEPSVSRAVPLPLVTSETSSTWESGLIKGYPKGVTGYIHRLPYTVR